MFPTDPRAAIARMPYLVDHEPHRRLLIAGFDVGGVVRHRASFSVDGARPLDEPLLESSLWRDDVTYAAAVLFNDSASPHLQPLIDAWRYRGRTVLAAVWAGPTDWRSYLCQSAACTDGAGSRYPEHLACHPDFDPLRNLPRAGGWRRQHWQEWLHAIEMTTSGLAVEPNMLETLAATLFDIPIRDAVLAHSAGADVNARPAIELILTSMCMRGALGVSVPAHTCLAAMHYLDDELATAQALVRRVLGVEEYSLARLLHNGLEMHAPASLLARSFAHFSPTELIAA